MARKRLSDLLREEANKSEESEAGQSTADTTGSRRKPSTSSRQKKPGSSQSTSRKTATVTEKSSTTPASSETTVNIDDLRDDLKEVQEQAQQQQVVFQQQLDELQTELDKQIALNRSLKADLDKFEGLKAELEQAKKVALQLAEENTRMGQELKALKSQPAPTAQPASTVLTKTQAAKEVLHERQARALAHPIFPTELLPGQLSNQDLGWVD